VPAPPPESDEMARFPDDRRILETKHTLKRQRP
jgi:hypothetical protein